MNATFRRTLALGVIGAFTLSALAGVTARRLGSDQELNDAIQQQSWVCEGRIGGTTTFEADIGQFTSAPAATAEFAWQNDVAVDYTVSYTAATNTVRFQLGNPVVVNLTFNPPTGFNTLYIRSRAVNDGSRSRVRILPELPSLPNPVVQADGAPQAPAVFPHVDIVELKDAFSNEFDFSISGKVKFNWTGNTPTQSRLSFQFIGALNLGSDDDNRGQVGKKGALLIYPKLELRWRDGFGGGAVDNNVIASQDLIQDTIISLSNDGEQGVWVKGYYVHGDEPLLAVDADDNGSVTPAVPNSPDEREHTGWNFVDFTGRLTRENPVYWSINTGGPAFTAGNTNGIASFRILDPDSGIDPGRPDPLGTGDRALRGYMVLWATNPNEEPVAWNRLTGAATIVNYAENSAYEYLPYAFQALADVEDPMTPFGSMPGALLLNGEPGGYDNAPDKLLLDFYADPNPGLVDPDSGTVLIPPTYNTALSGAGVSTSLNTELTLVPVSVSFSQGDGPFLVPAVFNVWNENEARLSFDQQVAVVCFKSDWLRNYLVQFQIDILGTNRGKCRIDSIMDGYVPEPKGDSAGGRPGLPVAIPVLSSAMVGVQTKWIAYDPDLNNFEVGKPRAATTLVGQQVDDDNGMFAGYFGAYNVIAFDRPLGSGNIDNPTNPADRIGQLDMEGNRYQPVDPTDTRGSR